MTGGAAVRVQGEEQRRKNAALRGTGADGLKVRDMFPQFHVLPPVGQSVIHLQLESGTLTWESLF